MIKFETTKTVEHKESYIVENGTYFIYMDVEDDGEYWWKLTIFDKPFGNTFIPGFKYVLVRYWLDFGLVKFEQDTFKLPYTLECYFSGKKKGKLITEDEFEKQKKIAIEKILTETY